MRWLVIVFRLTASAAMCRQSKALSNTTSLYRCYMCVLPRRAAILMVHISASSSTQDFHKSTPFSNTWQIYRRPILHPKRSWFKRLKRLSASAFCSWLKRKHDSLSMMLMFLWPCLANAVSANHVVLTQPSWAERYEWCSMGNVSWSEFVLCFQQEEEDPDRGQPCMRCGDQCPGFRVHGWRYEP